MMVALGNGYLRWTASSSWSRKVRVTSWEPLWAISRGSHEVMTCMVRELGANVKKESHAQNRYDTLDGWNPAARQHCCGATPALV